MRRRRFIDSIIRRTCGIFAASAPLSLVAVFAVIGFLALPSIRFNGWHFFWTIPWDQGNLWSGETVVRNGVTAPIGANYGILVFLVGTLLTSFIALLVAVPVSLGSALFLSEIAPGWLAGPLGTVIEILAGVPSVVFGLWGIEVIAPLVKSDIGPVLDHLFAFIPFMRGPIGPGVGLLSASIVLAAMVIPIITAVTRDVLRSVPRDMREQGLALGVTRWELIWTIVLPQARNGIIAAVALGLGRAIGETMAVLMVSGSAINYLPRNIYSPVGTMAANIVALLDSAMTDPTGMALHALAELALVLFLITIIVNALVPVVKRGLRGLSGTGT